MDIVKDSDVTYYKQLREKECFPIVNRGKLWYDTLSIEQKIELKKWYFDWLDVTETKNIPVRPAWLNKKIEKEEVIY